MNSGLDKGSNSYNRISVEYAIIVRKIYCYSNCGSIFHTEPILPHMLTVFRHNSLMKAVN
jgi:hypothetical protein